MTPILFVAFPQSYGVWNSKSRFALEALGLWPDRNRGDSKGQHYEHVNGVLYHARKTLNENLPAGVHPVDLCTIDYFWQAIKVKLDRKELDDLIHRFRTR